MIEADLIVTKFVWVAEKSWDVIIIQKYILRHWLRGVGTDKKHNYAKYEMSNRLQPSPTGVSLYIISYKNILLKLAYILQYSVKYRSVQYDVRNTVLYCAILAHMHALRTILLNYCTQYYKIEMT